MDYNDQLVRDQLDTLAKIGGMVRADDDIEFKGRKYSLPERETLRTSGEFLIERANAEEEPQHFSRNYPYKAWDGAYATKLALTDIFGTMHQKNSLFKMAETRSIPIGVNETIEIPWGQFTVPGLEGVTFETTGGSQFSLHAFGPRKWRHHINGVFELVQKYLDEKSIYRGKAFDGSEMPNFVDLTKLDRNKIVFTETVEGQLNADLWGVIEYSKELKKHDQPLKRVVLLQGPYGTGKTSAGFLTAQIAVKNGWTFIYVRPGRDDMEEAFRCAHLYQPCVVFVEDLDTATDAKKQAEHVSRILDLFDGIESKNKDVILVATTNHVDKIHKGMLRPGRIDSVIEVGALDAVGIRKMVQAIAGPNCEPEMDWDRIVMSMDGFYPAFIKETIDRATRYSIVRNRGKVGRLATEDFVNAALGLRPQLELMESADEGEEKVTIDSLLKDLVIKNSAASAMLIGGVAAHIEEKINGRANETEETIQGNLVDALNVTIDPNTGDYLRVDN